MEDFRLSSTRAKNKDLVLEKHDDVDANSRLGCEAQPQIGNQKR